MNRYYRNYKIFFFFASIVIRFLFWIKPVGRRNIPQGSAIICSNHSHWSDPFLIASACSNKHHLHMMAKKELFSTPILSKALHNIGSFSVDRSINDISAIRTAMKFLKNGEKIVMFPEGTRADNDNAVDAKVGAVRIADKMNAPVVPVYVPRVKPKFKRFPVVIGEPYMVNPERKKLTSADYHDFAEELMRKILALKE